MDLCYRIRDKAVLVYLSDDLMVCLDGTSSFETPDLFAYMVVFEKVKRSELKKWRKQVEEEPKPLR